MSDCEEWGPWISHDGLGCPCRIGEIVHIVFLNKGGTETAHGIIASGDDWTIRRIVKTHGRSWYWASGYNPIIRYRIRKPRALQQLREMIATLPAPSRQKEDA